MIAILISLALFAVLGVAINDSNNPTIKHEKHEPKRYGDK